MKKLIILLLVVAPFISYAQQLKIYTDSYGYKYFALYAYGLPREVVRTNQEIKDSKYKDTGIVRRHHTTKYDDDGIGTEGYDVNHKLSFAFLVAPYNVDSTGKEMKEGDPQTKISWYNASGWDKSMDSGIIIDPWGDPKPANNLSEESKASPVATGCAAYRGPTGNDEPGTWRLPTQREALTMFTIMEQALILQGANQVENLIIGGEYWTSTELKTSSYWKVWYVDSSIGKAINGEKIDAWGKTTTAYARCVRDIDDDPINE